jgi:hypothetical protein
MAMATTANSDCSDRLCCPRRSPVPAWVASPWDPWSAVSLRCRGPRLVRRRAPVRRACGRGASESCRYLRCPIARCLSRPAADLRQASSRLPRAGFHCGRYRELDRTRRVSLWSRCRQNCHDGRARQRQTWHPYRQRIAQRPRGRPQWRCAHANPRRHHPPRHRTLVIKMIKRLSHNHDRPFAVDSNNCRRTAPRTENAPDDSVGLHDRPN